MENMTASPQMQLVKKLTTIMGAIPRVEKRGRNDFHKYDYAMEVDFLDAVRPLLVEHGVFVTTSITSVDRVGEITTIRTKHTFHDAETGATIETEGAGQGADKGDKGVYKAATGAFKYFIAKNFMISTGDDPEKHEEEKPAKTSRKLPPGAPNWEQRAMAEAVPQADQGTFEDKVKSGTILKTGANKGVPWTLYKIETEGHGEFTTFSKTVFDAAKWAKTNDMMVTIHSMPGAKGPSIDAIDLPAAKPSIPPSAVANY